MRVIALVLVSGACGACGRLGFDEQAVVDSRDAAAGAIVRDAAPASCDRAAPFGVPVPIAELNTPARDGTFRVLPDELSGYFWSYRSGAQADVYFAARADLTSPFTVTPVTGINTGTNELDPAISSDGAILLYRKNSPGDDLWIATATAPGHFAGAVPLAVLNSSSTDAQPYFQPDGAELVFESSRAGDGDLYRTTRASGAFVPPTRIAELATPFEEGDPVLSRDGLTIYFRSTRPTVFGSYNIFVATRASIADPFGAALLVPNVNSDAEDGPSALSADGCRLYLTSDRAGTHDIYVATRGT